MHLYIVSSSNLTGEGVLSAYGTASSAVVGSIEL